MQDNALKVCPANAASWLRRLERFVGCCAGSIGRAFFDGIVAYGTAMHGVPWPVVAKSANERPETDLSNVAFDDIDELIAWLNAQDDRVG